VSKNKAKTFNAQLDNGGQTLGWTVARVPFVPNKVWSEMIRLRVRGTVNGFAFRTSLFPDSRAGDGEGAYFLLVNREMQQGARVGLGDTAEFVLEPDLEAREAELPDELAVLLDEERGLRKWYDELTEYMRREIGKWVVDVKSDAARVRRATLMAERMLATMEGESDLPPVVVAAFKRRPKARAGWEKMSTNQRRGELFAVLYYQTPEAMQKRVEKLCDVAEKHS
jgi:hypothetical protein